ncbi:DUF402 domain-containing protein [Nocardia salmonicida]|uniref:DUF402 domain-containing protein n=1 Tax=Nocardia salmonicida TaxID=53431 RepID=A0ABZ1NG64_9NOCA|nr:hypothetical protein [Nocardia salmonicida]
MSVLLPLLVAAPAVTGFAGYFAREIRGPHAPPTDPTLVSPSARPRVEYFDLAELTSTDAKGYIHSVDRYEVQPWGVYLARILDRPHGRYEESWMLPGHAVRATISHDRPGHHRSHDYVLDIVEFVQVGPKRWRATDYFLDIAVRRGRSSTLSGSSELLAAHAAGHVDTEHADLAFERAARVLDGLAANDHDVEQWLRSRDITLTWM